MCNKSIVFALKLLAVAVLGVGASQLLCFIASLSWHGNGLTFWALSICRNWTQQQNKITNPHQLQQISIVSQNPFQTRKSSA